MDKLNAEWLKGEQNFYFRRKRQVLESLIEGTCINVGCGSHIIPGALNVDEGLPKLPYADESFDTVICSDVLEHIGPHHQAVGELMRIARHKVIITVPAYRWLFGEYDRLLGHKRRYGAEEFSGFEVSYLFWFLIPILFLRKLFKLRHRRLPAWLDGLFFFLSKFRLNFGTTILAVKYKLPDAVVRRQKVSVLIPVFNEERIIDRDVKAVEYILRRLRAEYEIIIVNDSSQDKTRMISEAIARSNRNVSLMNFSAGPTRRENLAQAFAHTTGDIIAFVDVDLVGSLRFLPDLIGQVAAGYDLATGSRYAPGARLKRKPFRFAISILYNGLMRFLFDTRIRDHMCGFKAFKRGVGLALVTQLGFDQSLRRGVFWDTELLVRAARSGYKIKEIPIWWKERNKSALSFGRELKAVPYIIGFWFRMLLKRQ